MLFFNIDFTQVPPRIGSVKLCYCPYISGNNHMPSKGFDNKNPLLPVESCELFPLSPPQFFCSNEKNAAQLERQEKRSITQTNFDFLSQSFSHFIQLPNAHLKAVFFFIARYGALLGSNQFGQFFLA